ncbi:hypothetical protein HF896_21105 [Alicycliphilus denitrificans]|uniref:Uncharacterized protein n=2 Tax=Alicycliphilus denitrificans TaxID=179636 RepID=F4G9D7_ALIDK|nr:hypothetical protein [Alicycliphilus denitrificans]GAO21175.1 hypothetical protein ALISP_0995 [Alicycliphilus sp. B1]ADV01854.1 hypothetical protein Alide_4152 [Alicycliphilus denitrificans BC]AEB86796.1 hypothetical protein Alide2_4493 [Alicycliphilus denitrificans K601]QKD45949.1 hypothetical protein HF896_21105 [Alicycliphilus denitrificans]GAO25450.1 hypothetical protein ALISP_5270 [Alicycliphilus sp. B1]
MDAPFTTGGVSIFGGPHASERVAQAVHLLEHLAPYLQRDGRDRLQLPGRAAVLVLAEELP